MNAPKQYSWESTLAGTIGAVIVILTVVTHLTARPQDPARATRGATTPFGPSAFHPTPDRMAAVSSTRPIQPSIIPKSTVETRTARQPRKPPDPLQAVLGPSAISGQFRLLTVSRTALTSTADKLTLGMRVVSHAIGDLVTPFQSAMLEVRTHALQPINPEHPFSYPVRAGNSQDEDIVFVIPSDLDLDQTVLRIRLYNEEKEIPLGRAPRDNRP
jgi:hypothetical protein